MSAGTPEQMRALAARAEQSATGYDTIANGWIDEAEAALRVAPDELDRRLAGENWFHKCMESRGESNRLRAVIENAPHTNSCHTNRVYPTAVEIVDGTWNGAQCTCWKADAL
ncbi:hypothetical protein [Curtobacterium sp. MCSS17_015]|uniref:hypothetical protein n=1 Tax=Curtobacterium sp. MCSS17_015 TaxID=2175666 RepID=UPI0011B7DD2B|nr:hypothetical protein [Curtobacterium sp. MCSS17_015]WIB25866.1 hypothetical protein DEJ18_12520 [Curtobacterium sp. MCSS17_015]